MQIKGPIDGQGCASTVIKLGEPLGLREVAAMVLTLGGVTLRAEGVRPPLAGVP